MCLIHSLNLERYILFKTTDVKERLVVGRSDKYKRECNLIYMHISDTSCTLYLSNIVK